MTQVGPSRAPSRAWLDASLALWDRRYHYRARKWEAAKARHDLAGMRKWRPLAIEAAKHYHERQRQIAKLGPVAPLTISAHGVNFIKQFEGFFGHPYDDGTGTWTIGYGHIEGVTPDTPSITRQQAVRLLARDLDRLYVPPVIVLHLGLTQNQLDATVSFVYNLGVGLLDPSAEFGHFLRAHNWRAAADSMLQYDHARINGQLVVLAGLSRRRHDERALFLTH